MGKWRLPTGKDVFVCSRFPQTETAQGYFHGYIKKNKRTSLTVPELKSTVYLLPEVAWPIIKQNVANTGNRLQCFEVTSDALG